MSTDGLPSWVLKFVASIHLWFQLWFNVHFIVIILFNVNYGMKLCIIQLSPLVCIPIIYPLYQSVYVIIFDGVHSLFQFLFIDKCTYEFIYDLLSSSLNVYFIQLRYHHIPLN